VASLDLYNIAMVGAENYVILFNAFARRLQHKI